MNAMITLCYRKIIDAQAALNWEQYVFEDSYKEFLMQFQFYNTEKKYTSFSSLIHENPAANKLHFLTEAAIAGYMNQLNNKIPDIKSVLGKTFLFFDYYRFEIIESDIKNKNKHTVAINFYTKPVRLLNTIGDVLLLALNEAANEQNVPTEMLRLQPFLSICNIQKTHNNAN